MLFLIGFLTFLHLALSIAVFISICYYLVVKVRERKNTITHQEALHRYKVVLAIFIIYLIFIFLYSLLSKFL